MESKGDTTAVIVDGVPEYTNSSGSEVGPRPMSIGDESSEKTYSRMRWIVLAVFCASNLLTSLNGVIYPPIIKDVSALWGVSVNAVNVITQISLILPFALYFYAMYFADRHPIEHAYYITAFVNLLGSALRAALPVEGMTGYYTAIFTQILISSTHPFLSVLPPRISATYFPPEQRGVSTTCGVLFGLLGYGAGMIVSPMYGGSNLHGLYVFHAIASAVPLVFSFSVFSPRKLLPAHWGQDPELARFAEQAKEDGKEIISFWSMLKSMATNSAFLRVMIAGSLVVAVVQSWISTIQVTAGPSFNSPSSIMTIAALFFGCGIFGAVICGIWLDKSRDPVKVGRGLMSMALPFVILNMLGWFYDHAIMVYIGLAMSAFFGFGLLGLIIELGIEYIYSPYGRCESAVSGLQAILTNAMAAVLISMSTPGNIFKGGAARYIPIFWLTLIVLCYFVFWTLPKKYKRMEAEQQAALKKDAADHKSTIAQSVLLTESVPHESVGNKIGMIESV